jgi:carbonic anhydrase
MAKAARASKPKGEETPPDPPAPIYNQQSPIDLKDSVYHPVDVGQVQFSYPLTKVVGATEGPDTNHAKVNVKEVVLIPLFGLRLRLLQLHFHAPSEHLMNGVACPLELHLVHEIQAGQSGSTEEADKLVIAVFFFASTEAKERQIMARFGTMLSECRKGGKSAAGSPTSIEFNPNRCLPDLDDRQRFFRYEGSLTSGEFDETVSWLVFERPVPILESDILPILEAADQDQRHWQPLNRRIVLRSFP